MPILCTKMILLRFGSSGISQAIESAQELSEKIENMFREYILILTLQFFSVTIKTTFSFFELSLLLLHFISGQRRHLCIDVHLSNNNMASNFFRTSLFVNLIVLSIQKFVTSLSFRHLGSVLFWSIKYKDFNFYML